MQAKRAPLGPHSCFCGALLDQHFKRPRPRRQLQPLLSSDARSCCEAALGRLVAQYFLKSSFLPSVGRWPACMAGKPTQRANQGAKISVLQRCITRAISLEL